MVTRLLLLLTLPCASAFASLGLRTDGHLDMPELNQAYLDGEKPEVRTILEGFLKHHPDDVTREEKMFTHLYLGVLWAYDSLAMARSASHFEALLQLDPAADPGDLPMPLVVRNYFVKVKRGPRERPAQQEFGSAGIPEGVLRSALEDTVITSFDNRHARRSTMIRFIPGKPVPLNLPDGIRTAGTRTEH
jgi:hypothetical protein